MHLYQLHADRRGLPILVCGFNNVQDDLTTFAPSRLMLKLAGVILLQVVASLKNMVKAASEMRTLTNIRARTATA